MTVLEQASMGNIRGHSNYIANRPFSDDFRQIEDVKFAVWISPAGPHHLARPPVWSPDKRMEDKASGILCRH